MSERLGPNGKTFHLVFESLRFRKVSDPISVRAVSIDEAESLCRSSTSITDPHVQLRFDPKVWRLLKWKEGVDRKEWELTPWQSSVPS